MCHHRTAPRNNFDVNARRFQGDDDVRKQNCGIDIVASDWLHGDFRKHVGLKTRIQHAGSFTQLAIFRKAPASLAHKPHGGTARGAAVSSSKERRIIQIPTRHSPHYPRGSDLERNRNQRLHGNQGNSWGSGPFHLLAPFSFFSDCFFACFSFFFCMRRSCSARSSCSICRMRSNSPV